MGPLQICPSELSGAPQAWAAQAEATCTGGRSPECTSLMRVIRTPGGDSEPGDTGKGEMDTRGPAPPVCQDQGSAWGQQGGAAGSPALRAGLGRHRSRRSDQEQGTGCGAGPGEGSRGQERGVPGGCEHLSWQGQGDKARDRDGPVLGGCSSHAVQCRGWGQKAVPPQEVCPPLQMSPRSPLSSPGSRLLIPCP